MSGAVIRELLKVSRLSRICALLSWGTIEVFGATLAGCGASSELVCKKDPTTGFEHCQDTNNYGEAAIVTGVAAAAWGVAGCTINGCEPPYRCNGRTKLCERIFCSADEDCPSAYKCDRTTRLCL